jgi:type II pantothenate kinase
VPHEDQTKLIAGIDIGASATKGVILGKSGIIDKFLMETLNAKSLATQVLEVLLSKADDASAIQTVAVSGGGSRMIEKELCGISVQRVDEITANGLGGLFLSEKRQGLIVCVGTGTSIVAVYDDGKKVNHIGGTGVGGGTVMGLARRMFGINDFKTLENMASKGKTNKADLTVADIVGGPVGIIPADATASNLARLNDETSPEDLAVGIFNLVSQVVGVVSSMAAKSCNLEEDVILVGRLVKSSLVARIIRETTSVFGIKAFVPENCEYCTAVGAAKHILRTLKVR